MVLAGALLTIAFVMSVEGRKGLTLSAQDKAATTEVKIDNFSFGPAALTVAVGSTVTWTNRDDIPHPELHDRRCTYNDLRVARSRLDRHRRGASAT